MPRHSMFSQCVAPIQMIQEQISSRWLPHIERNKPSKVNGVIDAFAQTKIRKVELLFPY